MYRVCALALCFIPLSVATAADDISAPSSLAVRIDQHLMSGWQDARVQPAEHCDDATFLRRVSLDLIGRIPTIAETRLFLADTQPDKRARCVSRLLDSPAYARHWATFWRKTWVPQADTPQFPTLAAEFEVWLESELRRETPYDQIVTKLLLAPRFNQPGATANAAVFLVANEFKPEHLAASTTRAFLGINLDCAQCHDHPFARWSQDQFWQTAAFFVRPTTAETIPVRLQLTIPNSARVAVPKLLIDPQPDWPAVIDDETGRTILSNWVTARSNPYFAKNAVNRVWASLFGMGICEPLDDLSRENAASDPELLDELARAFTESGFDLKYLVTAIVLSNGYQLSSATSAGSAPADAQLFARSSVRGLTGEQLYDSLRVAAGLLPERDDLDPLHALQGRKCFVEKFRIDQPGNAQRSILQALSLMNGTLTAEFTDVATTPTLRAVAEAPFLDQQEKLQSLYLATLGRLPTTDELTVLGKYLDRGGADADGKRALADIFWALINSSEFNTNH